ncbi:MAG: Gx transporter family protein [Erysipelotrichales bacterium]|nr:Gx transporter family protein [Erysipelotrichales bacterium]MBQ1385408.1 Gx transporter family protein [Erysipelotrichales bacterium]MBQ2479548.1 Gx transporter family protein [Erysipelotrichales bacterium]MBQ5541453.1 Gx transporter family protein [Erysipelotrichales bacterium]
MNQNRTKKLVTEALLLGAAILLQMIEPGLPLAVPGVKLGLANIIGMIALFLYGAGSMLRVNLMRVLLASLLRGTLFGTAFWLSLSGVMLSSVMVITARKFSKLSVIGLSVLSSVFHCLGQILAVSVIYENVYLISYLPMMWILSIPTGMLTGILTRLVFARIHKKGGIEDDIQL